jgi:hypothetical protein
MKKQIFIFLLILTSNLIVLNACEKNYLESVKKLKLTEAKKLITSEFYANSEKEIKIYEITNKKVWKKMQTQIYRVEGSEILFYAINDHKVTSLGGSYSYDLTYIVCNLDNDANYEMIYTYQFGSSVSRGILGIYNTAYKIEIDNTCIIPSPHSVSHFVLNKKSETEISVYVNSEDKKIMEGTFSITEIDNKKTLIIVP